ncbi:LUMINIDEPENDENS protein [Arabidopsis thaliana]|uniref:Homeobox protein LUMINIDEPENDENS n=2 Tax=Brassicaceae TaxID=3700 RepID=LUMI_ARATH|nr:Homeodomain-like superfamily protein [Arabidopsis thaliana]NP_192165.1 Homeodomain-like superfamily protein [Arabidopsis thaliana]Q38796.2 RecName: Full=Homeobox protein LUMINIDEPENDENS [Arabidopsis thaliana]AAC78261.1 LUMINIDEPENDENS protein [Arabidopsis thaliana]AEE82192.1 Homeodomain-like superfamily protein [Arabidopsis thaliana]AEE82193.1 Homeodomain-like superfamily protein [Arabidopsis thaliana]CAB80749.1 LUMINIDEPENDENS protein [Arabidopsis thaliana]CAJ53827.1 luminidependens [Ara|eukprot:NP_001190660.1 Homeodomain-like superfamily protein [Arabidopsis thaliana]
MDAFKEEIEIGSSVESLMELLDSQKVLFHSQIDQLQDVVVAQCKLTGVNPLAQEMAAGALSIKIGKRPRDLLNPKAVKYLQAVFAIKDAISKRESREISALFGITVAQVREFFVTQKTRVRKQVRLSREKVVMSNTHALQDDGVPENNNATNHVEPVPLNSIHPEACSISWGEGETVALIPPEDIPPDISDSDKYFVENIFSLLRKEETFSGQVKLMEWIMQIQDASVLIWFLSKGGVLILTTWLSQAASEEQTSVLLLILKVLCHLPLHKASPENMSAILQSVNGLRFYRISDISNRAKGLLSRWTKLFAKIQAMKKQNRNSSQIDSQSQLLLKQSIAEIMGDSSNPEDILSLSNGKSENVRRIESSQGPKLLLTSADDSTKKHMLGSNPSYNKERRKVQMVEQPGQKAAGKSPQTVRIGTSGRSRPMSADDIQKAKMRALYMQSKNSKKDPLPSAIGDSKIVAPEKPLALHSAKDSPPIQNNEAKTEDTPVLSTVQPVNGFSTIQPVNGPSAVQPVNGPLAVQPVNGPSALQPVNGPSAVIVPVQADEIKKPSTPPKSISSKVGVMMKMSSQTILKNCKRKQIDWHVPPGMELDELWRVAAGGNSKEADVQRNRNRRERETTYQSLQTIPLNPKEPWDREMDYDDSLTPEIPSQQPPEESLTEPQDSLDERRIAAGAATTSSSLSSPEPDLELLAALLKNPDLVYALTSGKPSNLAGQDMVKLLDVIKTGAPNSSSSSNKQVEERVEVSLPSPTPSTNPGMSGWGQEGIRNPFSRQNQVGTAVARSGTQLRVGSMQWHQTNEQSIPRHAPSAYSNSITLAHTEREQQQYMQPKLHHNLHFQQQQQQPISTTSYAVREPVGQMGTGTSSSWRSQQSQNSYYSHQENEIASASQVTSYQGNSQYMSSNPGYESWSPDNSPSRNQLNMRGQQQQASRKHDSSTHPYWNQNKRWR